MKSLLNFSFKVEDSHENNCQYLTFCFQAWIHVVVVMKVYCRISNHFFSTFLKDEKTSWSKIYEKIFSLIKGQNIDLVAFSKYYLGHVTGPMAHTFLEHV